MKKIYIVLSMIIICSVTGCSLSKDNLNSEQMQKEVITEQESDLEENVVVSPDYPEYENAETLVDSADLILSGTVKSIHDELLDVRADKNGTELPDEEKLLYTIFEISIDKIYKGEFDDDTIHIKRLGKGRGNVIYSCAQDATEINLGDKYLFCISVYEDGYPGLVNLAQSSYDMSDYSKGNDKASKKSSTNKITLSEIMEIID